MFIKEINVKESAQPAWVAVADARLKNMENVKLWNTGAITEASYFADAARAAFVRSQVYVNYRKKFIAIKVTGPDRKDLCTSEVRGLQAYAEARGYERVLTKKSLIFRIRK